MDWKKEEIAHHDKVAGEPYDKTLLRAFRFFGRYMKDIKRRLKGADLVLDYGCGTGRVTFMLSDEFSVVSMDISKEMVKSVKNKNKNNDGVLLVVGDGEHLPFKDNVLGGLVCGGVLHHIEFIDKAIDEQYRVLKYGGFMAIAEPITLLPIEHNLISRIVFIIPHILDRISSRVSYVLLKLLQKFGKRVYLDVASRTKNERGLKGDNIVNNLVKHNFKLEVERVTHSPSIDFCLPEIISYPFMKFINFLSPPDRRNWIIIRATKTG